MEAWTPRWSAAIQDDIHFAWVIPTWGIPWIIDVNQTDDQKKTGNWGLTKGPSAYSWGGTWFGIYKESKNKELAWEFIKFITCNSEQSVAWAKSEGDFISNLEAIDTLSKNVTMVNKTINQNPYGVFGPMIKEINGSIITRHDDIIVNEFQYAMVEYLSGKITEDQMWKLFKYQVEIDLGYQITVD
jgi:ABC-type glycerol-3-phosphate transport system substrate-binding protein